MVPLRLVLSPGDVAAIFINLEVSIRARGRGSWLSRRVDGGR